jgi:multiple sugar transport system substrate-binding protein
MKTRYRLTRRAMLAGTAAGAGLATAKGAVAQTAVLRGTSLTFWGGLIFSDVANRFLSDSINRWGQANGVRTEVVMINQNDTVQRVSAAVAANTLPDAFDLSLDLMILLARQNLFLPVDDLYARSGGAQGGWLSAVDGATTLSRGPEGRAGIPFGVTGNMLLRRNDVLSKAGFANPPSTWQELVTQAAAVNKPPLFGLGLALSNVGDGNLQVSAMQSFGGRIADDTGKTVAIKSDATREHLRWVKDAWDRKLFPPGVTTWDGAGDNQSYLAGQSVFIANTGSVGLAARTQDPELFAGTLYSSLPGGSRGVVSPLSIQYRSIARSSRNPNAARELIEHLAQPAFMNTYFENAIYGPVLNDQSKLKAFDGSNKILAGLLDLSRRGTPPGFPDVYNVAYADAWNNFVIPKMIQRVVIDNWDLDRAMDDAQRSTQAIYDKYK